MDDTDTTKEEKAYVAEAIITWWCVGDYKWLAEVEEMVNAGTLEKPFPGWKGANAFLDDWGEVMSMIDPVQAVMKEI